MERDKKVTACACYEARFITGNCTQAKVSPGKIALRQVC